MEDVSTDYKENSKKFWSFIKSKGQEWTGVAPLKNKMGFLQSDNKSKAEILNEQFQSVFTKENLNNCPNKGNSPYQTMSDKGNKTLGFIRRNLKDCTKPVKSAAYTSMVRPTMEYASSVWDPTNRKKIENLEKVQKRAARFVFNNYTDRTPGCVTKMVESLKWEKLEERRKYNRLCMLYKIKNGLVDIDSHQYIQANDSRTRGKDRLYQERTSSEAFGNSFFPKTIRDWNQLPANTTPANTVEGFRSAIKAHPDSN